jgi:hypothetical protein
LAFFRGKPEVSVDDLRALIPWVLHEKLQPNLLSAFFQKTETQVLLTDRVSWIHQLFDRSLAQRAAYQSARKGVVALAAEAEVGCDGLGSDEIRKRQERIRRELETLLRQNELNGPVHSDLVLLKGLHDGYQEQLDRLAAGGVR